MDWLRGLERGWEIHLWRLLRAQLRALGPLGKASGCRLPPALDTGEAVAGPKGRWRGGAEGGSRAQSLRRSLLRGSRAQGPVLGPPEAALAGGSRRGAQEGLESRSLCSWRYQQPHAALGEDMDWADVSLPCTARLAPRVQRMGPGLPGARLPRAQAVPCCSRIAKPQRTGDLCASTYHCLTAPACPGHALHAALCPHPCLGEIPPISTGRTTGTSQALSSPGPADLSHPPAVCSQTALRMALGPALQGWGGSWSCCVAGRGSVPGGFPRPLPV
ncbi:uncharacterized protein LOC117880760 [Trachemys scripta elegans]|uniref:uncharacterized protein LOC117880760 n=1 Tax=Trachemys scripta elegans TaxID=31138 RepID=UPI001554C8D8|nr:uncharacterized protein LOC117880760 [Trachemys scripta elegans]